MFQRMLADQQWRTRGLLLVVGVFFVFAIAASLPRGQDSTSGSPTPTSTARSSATAAPAASPTAIAVASPTPEPPAATAVPTARPAPVTPQGFGNGTRAVGVDVAPGTYRTRTASAGCSWARLNAQGQLITGRSTNDADIVTIVPTDGFFRSTNCANWSLDLTRITNTNLGPLFDGTFLVGTDIVPGVWRATNASCTWWRLSEFTGDASTILGTGAPNTTVTILGSDRGFRSINCTLWQKVG
jgi:hypothetical protein